MVGNSTRSKVQITENDNEEEAQTEQKAGSGRREPAHLRLRRNCEIYGSRRGARSPDVIEQRNSGGMLCRILRPFPGTSPAGPSRVTAALLYHACHASLLRLHFAHGSPLFCARLSVFYTQLLFFCTQLSLFCARPFVSCTKRERDHGNQ